MSISQGLIILTFIAASFKLWYGDDKPKSELATITMFVFALATFVFAFVDEINKAKRNTKNDTLLVSTFDNVTELQKRLNVLKTSVNTLNTRTTQAQKDLKAISDTAESLSTKIANSITKTTTLNRYVTLNNKLAQQQLQSTRPDLVVVNGELSKIQQITGEASIEIPILNVGQRAASNVEIYVLSIMYTRIGEGTADLQVSGKGPEIIKHLGPNITAQYVTERVKDSDMDSYKFGYIIVKMKYYDVLLDREILKEEIIGYRGRTMKMK